MTPDTSEMPRATRVETTGAPRKVDTIDMNEREIILTLKGIRHAAEHGNV
jgi:hypothetical protein